MNTLVVGIRGLVLCKSSRDIDSKKDHHVCPPWIASVPVRVEHRVVHARALGEVLLLPDDGGVYACCGVLCVVCVPAVRCSAGDIHWVLVHRAGQDNGRARKDHGRLVPGGIADSRANIMMINTLPYTPGDGSLTRGGSPETGV